jgi:S1-C subfamily serine protease/uncharacterized protein
MWIVALIIWVTLSGGTAAAFECTGVKLPSSVVICSDPELMRLADERQEAINEARGRIGEEAWLPLWEDQKDWVHSYATACGIPPDKPPPIPVPASVTRCFKRAAEARVAYLRAYGPAPVPELTGTAALDRVGPGFDCSKARAPLALMLCADRELSRVDFRFSQAYWALLQQLSEFDRPHLKQDDVQFIAAVQDTCGVPRTGGLTAETWGSRNCVKDAYEEQRRAWVSRLTGPARDEGTRAPERHILLERKLQQLGFLTPPPVPEGVYGRGTRQAIMAWQQARGRPITGLLGEAEAVALEQETAYAEAPRPEARQREEIHREATAAPVPLPKAEVASTGTAFAINNAGDFLTNYHVVKTCASVRLKTGALRTDGTVVANDQRNDLAVVRAQLSAIPRLHFREGKAIRAADPVVVLGFPYAGLLATAPQVTTGAVSALAGLRDDTRYLQLTAPVQPGNSGGPLLDLSGNVVGIVSARCDGPGCLDSFRGGIS